MAPRVKPIFLMLFIPLCVSLPQLTVLKQLSRYVTTTSFLPLPKKSASVRCCQNTVVSSVTLVVHANPQGHSEHTGWTQVIRRAMKASALQIPATEKGAVPHHR